MKQKLLLKTMLAAALLGAGANSAWAVPSSYLTTMTGRVGLTNFSSSMDEYASKQITLADGESYVYTFTEHNNGASGTYAYEGWMVEGTDGTSFFNLRNNGDNWVAAEGFTKEYTGDTYTKISSTVATWLQAYNGVTVTLTISRSGNVYTVEHSATTNAVDEIASQTYSGTYTATYSGSGTVNIYLTNQASYQDIQKVVYTNDEGGTIYAAPQMTYVDYDNATTANGEIAYGSTARSGYNKLDGTAPNQTVGFAYTSWGVNYITYINADASDVPENATITTATLAFSQSGSTDGKRTTTVGAGYNSATWSSAMTYETADKSIITVGSTVNTSTKSASVFENKSIDIISAFSGDADNIVNILLYETAAAGCYIKNPELTISYTTETTYTATFTETNSLSPTITIYSDEDMTSEVTNGTLTDGTTYYYKAVLTGYRNVTGNFTVNGANPSINFTMTAKETYTYSLKYKLGNADAVVQATATLYEDETASFFYPVCRKDGSGNYYIVEKNANAPYYGVTMSSTNADVTLNYILDETIVYYSEYESICKGVASYTYFSDYSSNGYSKIQNSACMKSSMNLAANGVYDITIAGGNRDTGHTVDFSLCLISSSDVISDAIISRSSITANTWVGEMTASNVTIPAGSELYVANDQGSPNNARFAGDYVIVRKSFASIPVTEAGFATLYTGNALDFSGVDGLKAYTATCDGSTVTLTQVSDIPANTGVVLKGEAGTYDIPVITSSETARGSLQGSTTDATAYNAYDGYDLYMLAQNASGEAQFTKVSTGSIAAGKAFLKLESSNEARTLNVVYADDEAAGISTVNVAETVADGYYNLQGLRVSQPQKGLYIVNGKKVIKK